MMGTGFKSFTETKPAQNPAYRPAVLKKGTMNVPFLFCPLKQVKPVSASI
jgi:hypothetical protein